MKVNSTKRGKYHDGLIWYFLCFSEIRDLVFKKIYRIEKLAYRLRRSCFEITGLMRFDWCIVYRNQINGCVVILILKIMVRGKGLQKMRKVGKCLVFMLFCALRSQNFIPSKGTSLVHTLTIVPYFRETEEVLTFIEPFQILWIIFFIFFKLRHIC